MVQRTRLVVALTGASGALYGVRFMARALELGGAVDFIASEAGVRVAREELGCAPDPADERFARQLGGALERFRRLPVKDIGAEPASGSAPYAGMAIIPASMGTLARIAAGLASTLIERAADVTLKEGRPLVLVPRETPLNRIHLDNLLRLRDAGAVILPAMPAFYGRPASVEQLVDTVVDRALAFFFGPGAVRFPWQGGGAGARGGGEG